MSDLPRWLHIYVVIVTLTVGLGLNIADVITSDYGVPDALNVAIGVVIAAAVRGIKVKEKE